MKKYLCMIALACMGICTLSAQDMSSEVKAVEAVIHSMFAGMQAGDSAQVHAVFSDDVKMATAMMREGEPMLFGGDLKRFLKAVGTPHDKVWDERISDLEIRVDGRLASAWMNYSFYLGEDFSHCGINTMVLFHGSSGWKIVYLADTRRKENCE